MRFGDDWTGIFIRGDNAGAFALALEQLLVHAEAGMPPLAMMCNSARALLGLLRGSDERCMVEVQQLRSWRECQPEPVSAPSRVGLADVADDMIRAMTGRPTGVERVRCSRCRARTGVDDIDEDGRCPDCQLDAHLGAMKDSCEGEIHPGTRPSRGYAATVTTALEKSAGDAPHIPFPPGRYRCRCVGGGEVAGLPPQGCGEVLCKAEPIEESGV